jgi:hypothetical protein
MLSVPLIATRGSMPLVQAFDKGWRGVGLVGVRCYTLGHRSLSAAKQHVELQPVPREERIETLQQTGRSSHSGGTNGRHRASKRSVELGHRRVLPKGPL